MTQELVGRVLATRSPEVARRSSVAAGGFYLLIGVIPLFLGLVGIGLVPDLAEPEQVLAVIAQKHLSTVLYILFAGALVSAILSTVDSALLAAAALVSHNLVLPLWPRTTERRKVLVARVMVVVLGLVAYVLALKAEGVHDLVENASALGSAGIFVVVMFGLFTRFGGASAALASLIAGIVVWSAGSLVPGFDYPYLASFVVSLFAYVGVAGAGKVIAAVRPGTSDA